MKQNKEEKGRISNTRLISIINRTTCLAELRGKQKPVLIAALSPKVTKYLYQDNTFYLLRNDKNSAVTGINLDKHQSEFTPIIMPELTIG